MVKPKLDELRRSPTLLRRRLLCLLPLTSAGDGFFSSYVWNRCMKVAECLFSHPWTNTQFAVLYPVCKRPFPARPGVTRSKRGGPFAASTANSQSSKPSGRLESVFGRSSHSLRVANSPLGGERSTLSTHRQPKSSHLRCSLKSRYRFSLPHRMGQEEEGSDQCGKKGPASKPAKPASHACTQYCMWRAHRHNGCPVRRRFFSLLQRLPAG